MKESASFSKVSRLNAPVIVNNVMFFYYRNKFCPHFELLINRTIYITVYFEAYIYEIMLFQISIQY